MTDNEIIKELEKALKVAEETINRQKTEIERLKAETDQIAEDYSNLVIEKDELFDEAEKLIKKAGAEAVEEFVNYIQEELMYHIGRVAWLVEFGEDKEQTKYYQGVEKTLKNMNTLIDEKLKEKVGDADG